MRQGKRKEREGEKAKSESRKCCATFKPKNYVGILLSTHAELLHLAEKAAECITWKRVCRIGLALKQHDSDRKTPQLASKRVFRPNL